MDFNRPAVGPRQRLIAEAMGIDVSGLDDEAAGAPRPTAAGDRLGTRGRDATARVERHRGGPRHDRQGSRSRTFMSVTNPRKVESEDEILEILQSVY